jgi:hypothetical protein
MNISPYIHPLVRPTRLVSLFSVHKVYSAYVLQGVPVDGSARAPLGNLILLYFTHIYYLILNGIWWHSYLAALDVSLIIDGLGYSPHNLDLFE